MKNIWICGANGQLGKSLQKYQRQFPQFSFLCTDREVDITQSQAVEALLSQHEVDAIINCAAYTAVDKAEDEPEQAQLLNATAPGILAQQAAKHACRLVHISTDYVFDGTAHLPYTEKDECNPQSEYGKSKRAGEQAVETYAKDYVIIRTSWLYSEFGNNFLKTIDKLSQEREQLKVVSDQIGTPTYASDLAWAILAMLSRADNTPLQAYYHFSNQGVASWYDFAHAIVQNNQSRCTVLPYSSNEYPQKASRPYYSILSKQAFTQDWQIDIPHWQESLQKCMENNVIMS